MTDALVIAGQSTALYNLVEHLAREIVAGQFEQEKRFVQLGAAILQIRSEGHWRNWGFKSFGAYIDHLRTIVGKERSTLYGYTSTVEALLPVIGQEKLEQLGINKALALRAGMKYSGKTPSPDLLAKAADPAVTTEELKGAINSEFRIYVPTEEGTWHELGFYCDDDEWLELEQAINATKRALNLSNTQAESYQIREVILAWARDFMSGPGVEHAEV